MTQRIVSDAESVQHARFLFDDFKKAIVWNNNERIYLLRKKIDTLLSLITTKTSFKAKGFRNNTYGKRPDFFTCDLCHYGSCTRTGTAAFTCSNKNHISISKSFTNLSTRLFSRLAANLWVSTRTKATSNLFANMNCFVSIGKHKCLAIRINCDKFNTLNAGFYHSVNRISAATANDLNHREVVRAKNLLHICSLSVLFQRHPTKGQALIVWTS